MNIDFGKFMNDGFLHISKAISGTQLAEAQRACGDDAGWGSWENGGQGKERGWRNRHGAPAAITALITPALRELIKKGISSQNLWGDGGAQHAQVLKSAAASTGFNPHVDGAADLLKPVHVYGLQVGIYLTDLPKNDMGNFTIWPGSHKYVQAALFGKYEHQLAQAIWDCARIADGRREHQILAQAGDIVISHHLLLHGTAPNRTDTQRDMIFFRLYPENPNELHQRERERRIWDRLDRYCIGWK